MTSQADIPITHSVAPTAAVRPALAPWRVFYWQVRRELWEHRSVWIAPLSAAGIAFLGFLIGAIHLPRDIQAATLAATAHKAGHALVMPYQFMAFAVVATGLIVAIFYSMSALHNERRDRSLLFWKSLPVSDLITVLAKAAIPLVIIPAVVVVTVVAAQLVMLALSILIIAAAGLDPGILWAHARLLYIWQTLTQGVPVLAVWYAPLYGWLIMVSAWARRVPYLWAFAPPLGLALIERLALGSDFVWSWLKLRMVGPFIAAATQAPEDNPANFDNPHLWIGIALGAAFLAVAIRLRRYSDPI